MLVIRRVEAWCDKHPILGLDARGNRSGRHDAGEFYLVLDRTILVKIPVESVLVIADSGNTRDHQAARAPDLGLIRSPIDMLPEKAEVLFVHADCVRHMHNIATAVDHMGIEIA